MAKDDFELLFYDFLGKISKRAIEIEGNNVNSAYTWNSEVSITNLFEVDTEEIIKTFKHVGIRFNNDYYSSDIAKDYILSVPVSKVLIQDGWFAFNLKDISLDIDKRISKSILRKLFSEYIEVEVNGGNKEKLLRKFSHMTSKGADYNYYKNWERNIFQFQYGVQKFETQISRKNFLSTLNNNNHIRLGLDNNGGIVWDLPTFLYQNNKELFILDFSAKDFVEKRDKIFYDRLYRLKHFDNYKFKKKTQDFLIDIVKKHTKKDKEFSNLERALERIFETGIDEICKYQQNSHLVNILEELVARDRIFEITENARNFSESYYWGRDYQHKSYVAVRRLKSNFDEVYYRIQLIPMSDFARISFWVDKDCIDNALGLIIAYFSSSIANKRQRLLIRSLFKEVGIRDCKTEYDLTWY